MSRPPQKPSARFALWIEGANSASRQEQNQVVETAGEVPMVLTFVIPFWGAFLAPPLLAVVYAYECHVEQESR